MGSQKPYHRSHCSFIAENNEQVAIDDVDGTLSEEEFIEFEDGLLFYNPQKSVVDDEEYLVTILMKGKKGYAKQF